MLKRITSFEGRTAVITGAAGGIGRALSRLLWGKGCRLALVDVDSVALEALAIGLCETRRGSELSLHTADVSNRDAMRALPAEVVAAHGHVNLLVNNAGIGYEGAFQQTSLETWDRVLGINLLGMIHGCHFFLPYLARADTAHIVNMSSLFGFVGMPGQSAYCTSKYAVRGFSESLREELITTNIGLTLVHPGSVATNIILASDGDDPELMEHLAKWYAKNAMAPQVAAERILEAVQKGHPRLLIGTESYLADYLKRLLPVTGNKLFCDLVIRTLGLEHMREKRREQWRQTMEQVQS
jgi:NAD(P)-dependent dehydrogenase (short-subunit alcohol dehydrogenase family)